jgi:hypothetical protein
MKTQRVKTFTAMKELVCQKCLAAIHTGDKYYLLSMKKHRQKDKVNRCLNCEPTNSETTNSDILAAAYKISEDLHTFVEKAFDWTKAIGAMSSALVALDSLDEMISDLIKDAEKVFPAGNPSLDILYDYDDKADSWNDETIRLKALVQSIVGQTTQPTPEQIAEVKMYMTAAADAGGF